MCQHMSPETHKAMGDAAALIRLHLWQGKTPPTFSGDKREWDMSRELSIWKLLVKSGFKPEGINGAIAAVRGLRPDWDGRRLSLRVFYWKSKDGYNSTPFLNVCIGQYWKNKNDDKKRKKRLPPSIQDTLRGMVT